MPTGTGAPVPEWGGVEDGGKGRVVLLLGCLLVLRGVGGPEGFPLCVCGGSRCLAGVGVAALPPPPPPLPGVYTSICGLSVRVQRSLPILPPPRRAWGSLRVHGAGPSPIPCPIFISRCTTGTVMPNKTVMGSSSVAVSRVAVQGGGGHGGVGHNSGVRCPSVQQPQHGQGSTLPADEGAAEHGEDTPGDESSPVGTRAGGRWDRTNPQ